MPAASTQQSSAGTRQYASLGTGVGCTSGCSRENLFPCATLHPKDEEMWGPEGVVPCATQRRTTFEKRGPRTEGWLVEGGREGKTPPVPASHTYADWKSAFGHRNQRGEIGEPEAVRKEQRCHLSRVHPMTAFCSLQNDNHPESPRAGLQHAGYVSQYKHRLRKFRHLYCGHEGILFFLLLVLSHQTSKPFGSY